jgi:hypothetical protein
VGKVNMLIIQHKLVIKHLFIFVLFVLFLIIFMHMGLIPKETEQRSRKRMNMFREQNA